MRLEHGLVWGGRPAVQVILVTFGPPDEQARSEGVRMAKLHLEEMARSEGWHAQGEAEVIVADRPESLPIIPYEDPAVGQQTHDELVALLQGDATEVVFVTQRMETSTTPGSIGASLVAQTRERLSLARLLDHPGESGRAREEAIRQHLQAFLPSGLGLETGFVIDASGRRSRQIDLILYFSDYHPLFRISGIPLVPVEAVVAVFEVKAEVGSRAVLHDCYDVLASVKLLDRSNLGRNYLLMDREPVHVSPEVFEHFQLQVFGVVVAERGISADTWFDATSDWCKATSRSAWPNCVAMASGYVGTYRAPHDPPRAGHYVTPDVNAASELVVLPKNEHEDPLAWLTVEVLNFVRVARRVDYSPSHYMGTVDVGEALLVRPLPVPSAP